MTVKELIEELQKYPENLIVRTSILESEKVGTIKSIIKTEYVRQDNEEQTILILASSIVSQE